MTEDINLGNEKIEIPWVWNKERLSNDWSEKDLVSIDENWTVSSLNKGLDAAPLQGFIIKFSTDAESGFDSTKNFQLYIAIKMEEEKAKERLMVLVQNNKKYTIDLNEMNKKLEEEEILAKQHKNL